jgi:hypothetical protein
LDISSKRSFCTICENREFSLNTGIICGITKSLPEFEEECPNYLFDKNELQKRKRSFEIETKEKYHSSKIGSFLADQSRFISKENIEISRVKYPNNGIGKIFKTSKFSLRNSILFYLLITSLLIGGNIKNEMGWNLESPNIIGILIFSILSIIYIVYNFYNDKIYFLSIEKDFINFNGLKLPWNSIIDYGLIVGKSENKIILSTLLNGNLKIDLNKINITNSELINLIRENRKTFYNKV